MKNFFGVLAALAVAACSFAHHGRRFLLVTEFRMPHPGNIYAISDFSAMRFSGSDSACEFEPGLLFALGAGSRAAFELHSHIEKEGAEPWSYEATGFELRTRLGKDSPGWNFAGGIEVEAPAHAGPTPLTAELIAGREDTAGVWALNLFANDEEGIKGKTDWIYRAGWSPNVAGPIGFSIEAQGALARDAAHEVVVGAAASMGENRLFKFGIGKGFGPGSANVTLHVGMVFELK
jgi:hypothetical protein